MLIVGFDPIAYKTLSWNLCSGGAGFVTCYKRGYLVVTFRIKGERQAEEPRLGMEESALRFPVLYSRYTTNQL